VRADGVEAVVLGEPLVAVEGREEVQPASCSPVTAAGTGQAARPLAAWDDG
jgi:hypothetical protein